MKRITIDGGCLSILRPELPAQWFKLFVPLGDGHRSNGRAYTVRSFDQATRELDIDLFLHGDSGPVSAWAERAQVGDRFEISDVHPRSGFSINAAMDHYLLFGDETALPAIGAILKALPAHAKAHVFAEVATLAERQELTSPAALSVTWLFREDDARASAMPLEAAARSAEIPAGATTIWVAAESTEVAAIRKLLLKERRIDHASLHATGYWKRGEADHRDEEA
ncbi:siderophore-interacting protein [Burkholderia multivorans]|uniref:siderophore-interacting protein n=1 Tax=Burkholderia multivorans TaxID=87883 RepID=UPI00158D2A1D|nr:siderophore-interacting protein [Burkholderia multivorans]